MDLAWGDERTKKFVTNIGLITSNGPYGHDIMAAEWAHHVSYNPGIIAISIRQADATHENITKTKEFGVNLAAHDQNVLSSVAGNYTGKEVDKIAVLKELGYKFFKASKINVLMVDASMNAECELIKKIVIGDHTTFIGEVVYLYPANNKEPLVYHAQKYWKLNTLVEKPNPDELDKIKGIVERFRKK
ncbi:flavin reductase family protein [Candidatus Woesearchaeota archaeon]|nr:flavin reductase family protein [Candidatus Woesearchaeota archaeon]